VLVAGKSRTVYLLNGSDLGGIGGQEAILQSACNDYIDGGTSVVGTMVYLPCLSGIVAVEIAASPPNVNLLWSSGAGGGPPIVAGGLVWTIGQNGTLYGLDVSTGAVEQEASIGVPSNHFSTPSVGDGLLLAPSSTRVVAFSATMTATPNYAVSRGRLTNCPTAPAGASRDQRSAAILSSFPLEFPNGARLFMSFVLQCLRQS